MGLRVCASSASDLSLQVETEAVFGRSYGSEALSHDMHHASRLWLQEIVTRRVIKAGPLVFVPYERVMLLWQGLRVSRGRVETRVPFRRWSNVQ